MILQGSRIPTTLETPRALVHLRGHLLSQQEHDVRKGNLYVEKCEANTSTCGMFHPQQQALEDRDNVSIKGKQSPNILVEKEGKINASTHDFISKDNKSVKSLQICNNSACDKL